MGRQVLRGFWRNRFQHGRKQTAGEDRTDRREDSNGYDFTMRFANRFLPSRVAAEAIAESNRVKLSRLSGRPSKAAPLCSIAYARIPLSLAVGCFQKPAPAFPPVRPHPASSLGKRPDRIVREDHSAPVVSAQAGA